MVPEAPIDGTMPSVFPEDRSGDFTFTRGSNLAATRVASNGLIEKGRENLLLQSNQFDTTWANTSSAETGGQTGYDGSSDAWLISTSGNGGRISQSFGSRSGLYRVSVYAKAASSNWLLILANASSNGDVYFDLQNGVIGNEGNAAFDAQIESVGDGWYRCSFAGDYSSLFEVRLYPAAGNFDVSGNNSIYIQDAQLEVGLVATGYIESGATTGKAGLLENEPRIDFTGGGCGSLLLEPQRSNLITQSEYFGSADWSKQNSIRVNTNSHLSPEGIQNATELDGFDSSNFQSVTQYITLSDGTYTFSVFLKKTTGALTHYPAVVMGSIYKYVIINSTTGTYAEATGTNDNDSVTIESWDDNWWRVSLTNTLSAGAQRFAIYPSLSANGTSITTSASGANVFFGAQVEQGSYPTSYIPTHGNIVTRSLDAMNNSSLGLTDCTFFVDFVPRSSIMGLLDFYDNSNARAFYIAINSVNYLQFNSVQGGTIGDVIGPITIGNKLKLAFTLNASTGDVTIFVNGTKHSAYSTTISSLNKIAQVASFGYYNNTEFNQISAFPTALTDEECSALTQP